MELDFDKEIDALLRTMPKSDADFAGKDKHLDADEISAFAENALPEKARKRYTMHLADCDSCRKNLSELILLNAENEPEIVAEKAEAETVAPAQIPWYRKLFAFPNLAYTMGALILAFVGLTAFIGLQNLNSGNSEVAQSNTASRESETAPYAPSSMNSNASAAKSNDLSDSAQANSNVAENTAIISPEGTPEFLNDNKTLAKSDAEPLKSKSANEPQDENKSVFADKVNDAPTGGTVLKQPQTEVLSESARTNEDDVIAAKPAPIIRATPGSVSSAPKPAEKAAKRKEVLTTRGAEEERADKDERDRKLESQGFGSSRKINGKTFTRKGSVWYDSAYRNQPTTNVRRNTNEYRNLDSGLRSIGNQLDGVIVVVWKEKAYRIE